MLATYIALNPVPCSKALYNKKRAHGQVTYGT